MTAGERNKIPLEPVSREGRDSLVKETVTLRLSEKAKVWAGRPRIAGLLKSATLGTMCPSITLESILSRDTACVCYTKQHMLGESLARIRIIITIALQCDSDKV